MEYMRLKGYSVNGVFANIPELFSFSEAINKSEDLKKM